MRIFTNPRKIVSIVVAVSGLAIGCTAIVGGDPVQCKGDGDCTKLGGIFTTTQCVQGVCRIKPECTKTSDCAETDVCNKETNKCAPLEAKAADGTPLCYVVDGNNVFVPDNKNEKRKAALATARDDKTVLFGLMGGFGANDGSYFSNRQYPPAAAMALKQLKDNEAGLPGGRRIVAIACRDTQATTLQSAQHLIRLGAKFIVGPTDERRLAEATTLTLDPRAENRVPIISGWVTQGTTQANAQDAVWISTFFRNEVMPPTAALLTALEAKIRSLPLVQGGTNGGALKVAAVVSNARADRDYADLSRAILKFNGKTAAENESDNPPRYKVVFSGNDLEDQKAESNLSVYNALKDFGPDIVVTFAGTEWASIVQKMEAAGEFPRRPFYITPILNSEEPAYIEQSTESLIGSSKDDPAGKNIRLRVWGIRPVVEAGLGLYLNQYRSTYGERPQAPSGKAYESTLLGVYAMMAAQAKFGENFTALQVGQSILSVTDNDASTNAEVIPADSTGMKKAAQLLNSKKTIRLQGLFTKFRWNPKTQNAVADWEQYCVFRNSQAAVVESNYNPAGLTFDPRNASFGTNPLGRSLQNGCEIFQ